MKAYIAIAKKYDWLHRFTLWTFPNGSPHKYTILFIKNVFILFYKIYKDFILNFKFLYIFF